MNTKLNFGNFHFLQEEDSFIKKSTYLPYIE